MNQTNQSIMLIHICDQDQNDFYNQHQITQYAINNNNNPKQKGHDDDDRELDNNKKQDPCSVLESEVVIVKNEPVFIVNEDVDGEHDYHLALLNALPSNFNSSAQPLPQPQLPPLPPPQQPSTSAAAAAASAAFMYDPLHFDDGGEDVDDNDNDNDDDYDEYYPSKRQAQKARSSTSSSSTKRTYSNRDSSNKPFTCPNCFKSYTMRCNLNRHRRVECNREPKFSCPVCHTKYYYRCSLVQHAKALHDLDLNST